MYNFDFLECLPVLIPLILFVGFIISLICWADAEYEKQYEQEINNYVIEYNLSYEEAKKLVDQKRAEKREIERIENEKRMAEMENNRCEHEFAITSRYNIFTGQYKIISVCVKCGREASDIVDENYAIDLW